MSYTWFYKTPDGISNMWMTSDGEYLTGLWFEGSKDAGKHRESSEEKLLPVFQEVIRWLDIYFSGRVPEFTPKYRVDHLTEFRKDVIDAMLNIPYGSLITYGEIAEMLAKKRGIKRMSAQAVGGAVGWNPICIIIPCHRVMGSGNSLTGYGGGIQNKRALLEIEHHDVNKFILPKSQKE